MLDLPGIIEGAKDGKGRGRQIISVGMTCSLILIVLASAKPWTVRQKIEKELYGFGMRINCSPPDIQVQKAEKGGLIVNCLKGAKLIDTDAETIQQIAKTYKVRRRV